MVDAEHRVLKIRRRVLKIVNQDTLGSRLVRKDADSVRLVQRVIAEELGDVVGQRRGVWVPANMYLASQSSTSTFPRPSGT